MIPSRRPARGAFPLALIAVALLVLQGPGATRVYARAAQDLTLLDQQLDAADRHLAQGQLAEARAAFQAALDGAHARAAEPQIARALFGRADVATRQRRFADARPDAQQALEIAERLVDRLATARALLLISRIEEGANRADEARASAERSMAIFAEIGDRRGEASAGLQLTEFVRDTATLRAVTDRTVAAARAAGNAEIEGRVVHRLGDRLFNDGEYEESLRSLLEAKRVLEAAGATLDLGTVHNSLGRLYRAHGRLDEALREQQIALSMHQRTDTEVQRFTRMQSLNAVAVNYQRLGDFAGAKSYLEQALALAPRTNLPRAQDFLQANLATVLADMGQPAEAATMLEAVISRGQDQFQAIRHMQLSEVYTELQRYDEAIALADKALALCGNDRSTCASAYYARATAEARQGKRQAAREDMAKGLDVIEQLRAQLVPADFFRQNFSRFYQRGYSAALAMDFANGDYARAMEVAEQARARAFLDLLASRSLPPAPETRTLAAPPASAAGSPTPAAASPASTADLVSTAARLRSTLVAYWVDSDATYAWVVDGSGRVSAKRIAVSRAKLAQLVRRTAPFTDAKPAAAAPATPPLVTRGAGSLSLADAGVAWRELYTLLIAPIRQDLPTTAGALLTIVPHDVLSGLSFAALQGPRGRYLLEDFTLHYAPAGAMFQFTEQRREPDARTRSMLMVADPVPPRRSTLDAELPRLPGARSETAAIVRALNRAQASSLQDTAATEARVRELAPGQKVLHFATHAVVREDDPFASFLALGATGKGTAEDGVLTAAEVYGLRLQADLVVLSACRSAAGTVGGDAIATFARAFLYAGTASLVASMWDVADEPTNRLVPSFYRQWLGGSDKAAALRKAQLTLLADLRAGRVQVTTALGPVPVPEHPVFWAGFALFGEP